MEFSLAQKLIRFRRFCEEIESGGQFVDFDRVLTQYVPKYGQQAEFRIDGDEVSLIIPGFEHTARVAKDPATGTAYFFAEVPTTHVLNDSETQPRKIEWDHVWELARDFVERPVHEPSNCRLVESGRGICRLLQFDGQHKTSAQILLGRGVVPVKIYVNPDVQMIRELVIQIQQGIKKRPLSTSATLAKLDEIVRLKLDKYRAAAGSRRTERSFINSLKPEERRQMEARYLASLYSAILDDPSNKLTPYLKKTKKPSGNLPTTDNAVVTRVLREMVCREMLDEDIDAPRYVRDDEAANVLLVLNRITGRMLEGKWDQKYRHTALPLEMRRAQNFFYKGVMAWWAGILKEAVALRLQVPTHERSRVFLRRLEQDQRAMVLELVDELASWPIWSTEDAELRRRFRANTEKDVREALGQQYNEFTLIKGSRGT